MIEMDKEYAPHAVEEKWLQAWRERDLWHSDAARGGRPYAIVIPPPNVTGILHMGHALNHTVQDILIRWRRMQGRNAVWIPGTDHAGIATQNVVERALAAQGKSRHDLGREAFVQRVWAWREQYGGTIVRQIKRLGASCDWTRERFTMDGGLSDAVREAFVRLFDKGLIYRGTYIIHWCPRCRTALSDEESEHRDTNGRLYYLRYPVKDDPAGGAVVVATTRPETLLGDVAVAVNPADDRYRALVGRTLVLPALGREIPVIADAFVDPAFGTGAVKVTPAHDPNDFEIGRRHGLVPINVMHPDGTMNDAAGPYRGMDRFHARKKILEDLEARGQVEKTADHLHAVGHCYRCHTVVEPRLSEQWFVRMKPLAAPAIEAVRSGRIVFVPDRWTKVYLEWMENIRDWCISRQIWWGHRIPVFTCRGCGHVWAARTAPDRCPKCRESRLTQDEDVLDTWFSSWLWPFSTLGWPDRNRDQDFYYPTEDLVTASEIIFFWVARMIVAGLEFKGDVPFRRVYIHGTVRDAQGRKMSKSLGNSIDPLDIVERYSADALRFSLTMLTATGQDVPIEDGNFEIGRNFATKLWNAGRFLQMHSGEFRPAPAPDFAAGTLRPDDQYILQRLQDAIRACDESLGRFRFNDAAHALYEFVWHQFCDWYVEYSKSVLYGTDAAARARVLAVMHHVFSSALRLLHPVMPFVTEELWHTMGYGAAGDSIALAPWPAEEAAERLAAWGVRAETVRYVEDKYDLVRVGRQLRSDYSIPPSRKIEYIVRPASEAGAEALRGDMESVQQLLRASSIRVDAGFAAVRAMPGGLSRIGSVFMPVEGLIDVAAEIERLRRQRAKVGVEMERIAKKLENPDFVRKAPPEVVAQFARHRQELTEEDAKYARLMDGLAG